MKNEHDECSVAGGVKTQNQPNKHQIINEPSSQPTKPQSKYRIGSSRSHQLFTITTKKFHRYYYVFIYSAREKKLIIEKNRPTQTNPKRCDEVNAARGGDVGVTVATATVFVLILLMSSYCKSQNQQFVVYCVCVSHACVLLSKRIASFRSQVGVQIPSFS